MPKHLSPKLFFSRYGARKIPGCAARSKRQRSLHKFPDKLVMQPFSHYSLKTLATLLFPAILVATATAVPIQGGSNIISEAQGDYLAGLIGGGQQLTKIFSSTFGDSFSGTDFHDAANGVGDTFSILKLANGMIIGGYNPLNWNNLNSFTYSLSGAFLFNLTSNLLQYQNAVEDLGQYQTYSNPSYGPIFGAGRDLQVNQSLDYVFGFQFSYGVGDWGGETNIFGTRGGFTAQISSLEIFTTSAVQGTSVPDGGTTVTLLGLSLSGIGWVRRKVGSKVQ